MVHTMHMKRIVKAIVAVMLLLGMTSAIGAETGALTLADAKAIGLERAQLDVADVFMTQLSQDRDDGRQVFEVAFIADGREYEYDIDADTGEIIKESTETLSADEREIDTSLYLSMEEAGEKALAHAGVAAEQATFTEMEFDFDDGRAEYELRFTAEGQTYEVELDAQTGEVMKYEMKNVNKK